jgi:hypothetical protein
MKFERSVNFLLIVVVFKCVTMSFQENKKRRNINCPAVAVYIPCFSPESRE